uniref:Transmembrane protein n=1 Tax=Strongyloides venezuelensis TaxID=75913 RepID=A0A0K0G6A8_STRVS
MIRISLLQRIIRNQHHSLNHTLSTVHTSPFTKLQDPIYRLNLLQEQRPRAQFIHGNQFNNSISIIWKRFAFEIYFLADFLITESHRFLNFSLGSATKLKSLLTSIHIFRKSLVNGAGNIYTVDSGLFMIFPSVYVVGIVGSREWNWNTLGVCRFYKS